MGSEVPAPLVDLAANVVVDASVDSSCPSKKSHGKAPKRIHKAEREKMKREHLNDLFVELGDALELTQPNNGKASILSEATRLLRDLLSQIEGLKEENETLLSESHYVTVEKNELREENYALETQISKLRSEVEERTASCKPDLNVPAAEFLQTEGIVETTLQQPPGVFIVPLHQGYPMPGASVNVSKPHARYPTPADSWPSKLLGEQQKKDFQPDDYRIW